MKSSDAPKLAATLPRWLVDWAKQLLVNGTDSQRSELHNALLLQNADLLLKLLSSVAFGRVINAVASDKSSEALRLRVRGCIEVFISGYHNAHRAPKMASWEARAKLTKLSADARSMATQITDWATHLGPGCDIRYLELRRNAADRKEFTVSQRLDSKHVWLDNTSGVTLTDLLCELADDIDFEIEHGSSGLEAFDGGRDAKIRRQIDFVSAVIPDIADFIGYAGIGAALTALNKPEDDREFVVEESRVRKAMTKGKIP